MNQRGNTGNTPAYLMAFLLLGLSLYSGAYAGDDGALSVTLILGDYHFEPERIEATAGRPVALELVNKDSITPHNFTLQDAQAGLDLDVDVSAGQSLVVHFTPASAGSYTFYCDKKLPFMKSHRDRGMQGQLIVGEPR